MDKVLKILILSDSNYKPVKMYLDQMPKLAKGFIRLGHDVRHLSYCSILSQLSPFKSRSLSSFFFKKKVDETLARFAKHYKPDIVYISFAKHLDRATLSLLRETAPLAVFVGGDGDPWPEREKGRIETARELDILMATNNGRFLDEYRRAGVKKCVFMPNMCDPDIDRRYDVEEKWRCDVLWTGAVQHTVGLADGDQTRQKVIDLLAQRPNVRIYGCMGRPKIEGLNYLYAISGAKIGINVNAYESVRFCHSDRLTQYLACGTLVLAKRFDGCELLYKDKTHLRYFDEPAECMELIDWYLAHEDERKKIADSGMEHCHTCFNSVKIAGYILELIETGTYSAPWLQRC
jgi:glycosyltransferase involved in cell wall biosynthesis